MNPTIATLRPPVMCQVRSWWRPELQPVNMAAAAAKMNGGHVRRRVSVLGKPRVLTTLVCEGLAFVSTDVLSVLGWVGVVYIRWEKTVETAGCQVEVLHEAEDPCALVPNCLP